MFIMNSRWYLDRSKDYGYMVNVTLHNVKNLLKENNISLEEVRVYKSYLAPETGYAIHNRYILYVTAKEGTLQKFLSNYKGFKLLNNNSNNISDHSYVLEYFN